MDQPPGGHPFCQRGRDLERDGGLDCLGLVRLGLHVRFNIDLPDLAVTWGSREDTAAVERFMEEFDTTSIGWRTVPLGEERPGDILWLHNGGRIHVGLVVAGGLMLHVEKDADSTTENYRSVLWRNRILKVYRYDA